MTYIHLTTDELMMIESYHYQNIPVAIIAKQMKRFRQPIYNVIKFLKLGHTALDFYTQYKKNQKRCGRRKMILPTKQMVYIQDKVVQGWTPDVIVGVQKRQSLVLRARSIACSKNRSLMRPHSR